MLVIALERGELRFHVLALRFHVLARTTRTLLVVLDYVAARSARFVFHRPSSFDQRSPPLAQQTGHISVGSSFIGSPLLLRTFRPAPFRTTSRHPARRPSAPPPPAAARAHA